MSVADSVKSIQLDIDQELRRFLSSRQGPLYKMMEFELGWIDEQGFPLSALPEIDSYLHGSLCLMVSNALGGNLKQSMCSALAVELVHHFSLIHDDIKDGNPQRKTRSSLWWIWGPGQAINAGDGMHALARLALFELTNQKVSSELVIDGITLLDHACLLVCEGQYEDIVYQEKVRVNEESYFKMVNNRTGSLFGCAAELAGLLAGAPQNVRDSLHKAGVAFGICLQIHEDCQSFFVDTSNSSLSTSILNKRKRLPVIFAFEQGNQHVISELGVLYLKRVLSPDDIPKIREILRSVGALEYCLNKAEQYKKESLDFLTEAGLNPDGINNILSLIETTQDNNKNGEPNS